MHQAKQTVAREMQAVNQLIAAQLNSRVSLVEDIGQYLVEAGGKRLRPLLVLLAGGSCGEISSQHITQAAVIEFIHTATLLHDDVVDLSTLRRGRPTANAAWGNAPSVLVGDFLYTRAFQLLVDIGNMPLMQMMADVTNRIAEGEVLQLTKIGQANTSEDEYFDVIMNKTAVLFGAATRSAAMLNHQSEQCCDALHRFGIELGFAFQLIDDVLDYQGNAEELGKNVGDDLSEGKPTLPLIQTLKQGNASEQALVTRAITEKSSAQLQQIIDAVHNCGALDYTRELATAHCHKAIDALSVLPDSEYKQQLLLIAESSIQRTG